MNTAIVYIRGLATKQSSDWCGMRPFLENLAQLLNADLIGLDYDDEAGLDRLEGRLAAYDVIHAAGHSHGAAALYTWLKATRYALGVVVFLDLAPLWQPAAWMGPPWPAPSNAQKVLVFFQRNDGLLAGVRLEGPTVEETNVTAWGLHHASMCGDVRVQDRIALALLWHRAGALNSGG